MDRQRVKTEGPIILSNDIFYFKNMMIIGGSIINIARLHQTGATAPKVRIVRPHCAEGRAAIRCAEGAILLPKCAECAHNKYADVFFFFNYPFFKLFRVAVAKRLLRHVDAA